PEPSQLTQFSTGSNPLELFVTSNSIGQLDVFVNGIEAGHTRGMTEKPAMFQSPAFVVPLPTPQNNAPIVIAIRSWAGAPTQISRGLLARVDLGVHDDISNQLALSIDRQWNERILA